MLSSQDDYLNLAEVSARIKLSESTIRRYVRKGRIPYLQPGGEGGRLRFPPDCLERLNDLTNNEATTALGSSPKLKNKRKRPLSGRRPKWQTASTSKNVRS